MTPETTGREFTRFSETPSEQGTCFSKMSTDRDVGEGWTSNSEKLGRLGSAQQSSPDLSFLIVKNDMGEKRLFVDLGRWNWPLSVSWRCVLLWGTAPCPLVTGLGVSPQHCPSVRAGSRAEWDLWAQVLEISEVSGPRSQRGPGGPTDRLAGAGGGWLWPVPALKCSQGPQQRTVGQQSPAPLTGLVRWNNL